MRAFPVSGIRGEDKTTRHVESSCRVLADVNSSPEIVRELKQTPLLIPLFVFTAHSRRALES